MWKKIFFYLTIFFVIFSCFKNKNDEKKVDNEGYKVEVVVIKTEELVPEIQTFGTVSFKSKVDIYPKTSGRIEKLYVEQGDRVKKGELLAILEQFRLLIELKQATAELEAAKSSYELTKVKYTDGLKSIERQFLTIEKAKAELEDKKNNLENTKNTLENKEKLLKEGAVTEESVRNLRTQYYSVYTQYIIAERDLKIQEIGFRDKDIIEAGYSVPKNQDEKIKILKEINTQTLKKEMEVAESNLKIAHAKVDSVNAYLSETYIRAPMDGIIAARYLELGEEAKHDTKIFTVMDTYNIYTKINISESDLIRVKPNGTVIISIDALGKKSFEGKIKLISPIIDTKTRTAEISALFNNVEGSLIPGMFVRVRIKSNEKRRTIFIPASCLLSVEKDTADIFVVKKGLVFRKTIKIGAEKEERIEVLNGLNDGEVVVNNPPIDLVEGAKVQFNIPDNKEIGNEG